jgi:omega-6 fatty acid desaturase (delta-12 desaturase)
MLHCSCVPRKWTAGTGLRTIPRQEDAIQHSPQDQDIRARVRRPTNRRGFAWVLGESVCTGVLIGLSVVSLARIGSGWGWFLAWFLSQLVLGLVFFQWFVLMHGCGHRALFASRLLNDVFGHMASMFCLIPYSSWQYVHAQHHKWVGWMDKDPTTRGLAGPLPPLYLKRLLNFCWKFWIPFFSLVFGVSVFWNLRHVAAVAPSPRQQRRTLFSILLLVTIYAGVIALAGMHFLGVWAVAFVCFLTIGDPILLSQHVHLPLNKTEGANVTPFTPANQDRFTRTIIVPGWVAQWVLFQFTTHGAHHAYPRVAHYDIGRVPFKSTHAISWFQWLRAAKRMPAIRLLYESSQDTGISI